MGGLDPSSSRLPAEKAQLRSLARSLLLPATRARPLRSSGAMPFAPPAASSRREAVLVAALATFAALRVALLRGGVPVLRERRRAEARRHGLEVRARLSARARARGLRAADGPARRLVCLARIPGGARRDRAAARLAPASPAAMLGVIEAQRALPGGAREQGGRAAAGLLRGGARPGCGSAARSASRGRGSSTSCARSARSSPPRSCGWRTASCATSTATPRWCVLGVPLLAAVFPQDTLFYVTPDVLSPLLGGLCFALSLRLARRPESGAAVYAAAGLRRSPRRCSRSGRTRRSGRRGRGGEPARARACRASGRRARASGRSSRCSGGWRSRRSRSGAGAVCGSTAMPPARRSRWRGSAGVRSPSARGSIIRSSRRRECSSS